LAEHVESKGLYISIFLALMVFTAITTMVAFFDLGILNTPVALAIAVTKALLVVLFFMHVRHSTMLTKIVVFGGTFWLALMIGITMVDYVSRGWLPEKDRTEYRFGSAPEGAVQGERATPGETR
jgi:cytochrome c oxidase subunit 4